MSDLHILNFLRTILNSYSGELRLSELQKSPSWSKGIYKELLSNKKIEIFKKNEVTFVRLTNSGIKLIKKTGMSLPL